MPCAFSTLFYFNFVFQAGGYVVYFVPFFLKGEM